MPNPTFEKTLDNLIQEKIFKDITITKEEEKSILAEIFKMAVFLFLENRPAKWVTTKNLIDRIRKSEGKATQCNHGNMFQKLTYRDLLVIESDHYRRRY